LFAPELLPKSCERVIYLDCDLVVLRDIAELNNSVDGEHTVAAVSGVLYPYVSSLNGPAKPIVFNYADLGIPASNRYFQCGVMVINLQLWRQQNVTFRVINYLETHKEDVVYLDQGGLNAVLYDQWSRLDQRWNQTGAIFFPERWASPAYSLDEWHRTKNDPFIVHYDGGHKPWNAGFRRPRASFFYKYLKKTHFKRQHKIPAVALLEGVIGYKCYFFLWRSAKPIFANFKARMGLFVFWKVGKREWARGKS
jgi:lipopolysaccharide biosynthesis glycosyltransferase